MALRPVGAVRSGGRGLTTSRGRFSFRRIRIDLPSSAGGGERKGRTNINQVSAGYLRVIATPLLAGRDFDGQDTPSTPKVAIVTEAFAKQYFDGANPVGRTFRMERGAGEPDRVFEIIGLAGNSKYYDLREEFAPLAFLAESQEPRSIASVMAARAARTVLFEIEPDDPSALILATAILTLTGLAAALLPARRAARTEPIEALRDQ